MPKRIHEREKAPYRKGVFSEFLQSERLKRAAQFVKPGDSVLDLACNEGALLEYLPADLTYTGIDISEKAIERARTHYPQRTFQVADLTKPNREALGTTQFDVIVMLAFLEHVKNPGDLLLRYLTHLKPGGIIVVTTPAPRGRYIHNWGAKLGLFSKSAAEEHEKFLDRQTLIDIAGEANLNMRLYRRFLFGFNQLACLG